MAANPKLFPCDMSCEAQRLIAEVHLPPPCDAVTASSSCGLLSLMALRQFSNAKHSSCPDCAHPHSLLMRCCCQSVGRHCAAASCARLCEA